MRQLMILLFCCWASPAGAALLIYDGFDYAGGPPLNGQTNLQYGETWAYAGAGQNAPTVGHVGFSVPGLKPPAPLSKSVTYDFTKNGTARLDIPGGAINSGTVYWSGILHVTNVSAIISASTTGGGGIMLGGFNNSTGAQATVPTTFAGIFAITRNSADSNQYFIGAAVNNGSRVWATGAPQNSGDTAFVVVSYTFNTGSTTDDEMKLWVNPDPDDFGAAVAPAHTIQGGTTAGADYGQMASFVLRNVPSVGGPMVWFDELRIGDDWASVTVPEPSTCGLLLIGGVLMVSRRRFVRR